MQRTRAPAGVAASLLYTTSMAKRTKRAFVKHRKYAALVTDQDLSQLRSLVTTGVCRSCVGCTHVHANVVDIAVYDASRGEETGHMIAVIEFDRPIARSALAPHFANGELWLGEDQLYARLPRVPLYE